MAHSQNFSRLQFQSATAYIPFVVAVVCLFIADVAVSGLRMGVYD